MEGPVGPISDARPRLVLEIIERPASLGCSQSDRRNFRQRTIPRLLEEYGNSLQIVWEQPSPESCTLPDFFLDGQLLHSGGYPPWEILRPAVGWALALESGVGEMTEEARATLHRLGIEAADWQEGLLEWLRRREK